MFERDSPTYAKAAWAGALASLSPLGLFIAAGLVSVIVPVPSEEITLLACALAIGGGLSAAYGLANALEKKDRSIAFASGAALLLIAVDGVYLHSFRSNERPTYAATADVTDPPEGLPVDIPNVDDVLAEGPRRIDLTAPLGENPFTIEDLLEAADDENVVPEPNAGDNPFDSPPPTRVSTEPPSGPNPFL